MDKEHMTEHIKVNLPLTEQDYLAGNGEGVWVLVDSETKRPQFMRWLSVSTVRHILAQRQHSSQQWECA